MPSWHMGASWLWYDFGIPKICKLMFVLICLLICYKLFPNQLLLHEWNTCPGRERHKLVHTKLFPLERVNHHEITFKL